MFGHAPLRFVSPLTFSVPASKKRDCLLQGRSGHARAGLPTCVPAACLRYYDSSVSTDLNLLYEVAVDEEYIPPLQDIFSRGAKSLSCCNRVTVGSCARCLSPSLSQALSLASVSFSVKQPSADIRRTTRLSATATYANCSSGDVSSSFTLSSVDARVVTITSGSATGTFVIAASYQWKTATSSSIGNTHWNALRGISATRGARICMRQRSP
jgi:hypothetical protein